MQIYRELCSLSFILRSAPMTQAMMDVGHSPQKPSIMTMITNEMKVVCRNIQERK